MTKSDRPPLVEVVNGIIIRNHRVLLVQRLPGKNFEFMWDCPGGKVEGDESHHAALRRELHEEIGIVVGALPELAVYAREFPNDVKRSERACVFLLYYVVPSFDGAPKPLEGQGIGWFSADDLSSLTLAPGAAAIRQYLVEMINARK